MKWANDDIKSVEKFIEIKNKGYYADGKQVTEIYNRVLNKSVAPTNCGSCVRQRINELESALNQYKKQAELSGLTTSELSVELDIVEEQMEDVKNKIKTKKNKKK